MTRAWITNSSTTLEAMINPINAACQDGYVPTDVYLLQNPGTTEQVEQALDLVTITVESYGGDTPDLHVTELDEDTEFEKVFAHFVETIEANGDAGGEVAVDITPGRKYMSAIAFAAGLRYDADHVFYLYLASRRQHGKCFPEMARSATHLYDFSEVL